ncbi:MAG: efflux RND transporter periplasmic adaptor subunit [Planktomarina sp.]|nr:efflux RND transporter periplasmic adaptor subunit [Planktomarina sp.]
MKIRKSYISALIIAVLIIGWMYSDDVLGTSSSGETDQEKLAILEVEENLTAAPELITQAFRVANELVPLQIRARGVTRTEFEIDVISRRQAFVLAQVALEGGWVESGATLIELDKGTLEADVAAARAERTSRLAAYEDVKKRFRSGGAWEAQIAAATADLEAVRSNYESTKKLVDRGVKKPLAKLQQIALLKAAEMRLIELQNQSEELALSASYAQIKGVDARISQLLEQLKFTNVTASQSGWLEKYHVEVGQTIKENAPVARILGLKSLILDAPIPQTQISKIKIGDIVDLEIDGAGKRQGRVDKIATSANQATRTFNVEILLDNSDGNLRAGMSAGVRVIIDKVPAFKISPAHLNVDEEGLLSVKTVVSNGIVKIMPVMIAQTVGNAAYVSGLPDGTLILGMGQAFVSEGSKITYKIGEETN